MKNLVPVVTLMVALIIAIALSAKTFAASVEVEVKQGTLIGEAGDTTAVFKGIPFASPPTGVRRWRAPEPPAAWTGKRLATSFSPACPQLPYPEGSMFTSPHEPNSEDCLYLNVWTPDLSPERPLPVMVWIHGGGLTRGTGSTSIYDGTRLTRKGVIVVTINYRLGPFGYFAHPALTTESPNGSSGNYGTMDQIAALKWVQANIESFGGDPDNVTIFGESAGSWSVNHLTASPLASGLFQKAIGQSGAKFDPMPLLSKEAHGIPPAETTGKRFAEHLNVWSLPDLRALAADDILKGFATFRAQTFSEPNVDGHVFPDHIANIYRDGKQNNVALMLGSNSDEGTNLLPPPKDRAAADAFFSQFAGPKASEIGELYGINEDFIDAAQKIFRDALFSWNMTQWARLSSDKNRNTFLYYFTFVPPAPMDGKLGAYHAAEIRYAFDNAQVTFDGSEATATELSVADYMSDLWVSFAKNGKPTLNDGPKWRPYSRKRQSYMELGEQPMPKEELLADEIAAFDDLMKARWRE